MMNALSLASVVPNFVVPVRYVARGEDRVVHASSTALSVDDIHVRTASPPTHGVLIDLKLYLPDNVGVISRSGVVADTKGDEFRAEFQDSDELARQRISELLWRREIGLRPYPRFHTNLQAIIRERGRPNSSGYVTNISRSGAFVRLTTLPARGSVVELDLALPELAGYHTVHAYVVHLAPGRGVGLQFVGASEAFGSDLDRYLAQLAG
jgi:PilZ domain